MKIINVGKFNKVKIKIVLDNVLYNFEAFAWMMNFTPAVVLSQEKQFENVTHTH